MLFLTFTNFAYQEYVDISLYVRHGETGEPNFS